MDFIRVRDSSEHSYHPFTVKLAIVTQCALLGRGMIKALSGSESIFLTDIHRGDNFKREILNNPEKWNLIVLDRDYLSVSEITLLTRLINTGHNLPVVILSSSFSQTELSSFKNAGASACISKRQAESDYADLFINAVSEHEKSKDKLPEPVPVSYRELVSMRAFIQLTPCERSVIEYLFKGLTVTEISRINNKSIKTISGQKQSALRKLGLKKPMNTFGTVYQLS